MAQIRNTAVGRARSQLAALTISLFKEDSNITKRNDEAEQTTLDLLSAPSQVKTILNSLEERMVVPTSTRNGTAMEELVIMQDRLKLLAEFVNRDVNISEATRNGFSHLRLTLLQTLQYVLDAVREGPTGRGIPPTSGASKSTAERDLIKFLEDEIGVLEQRRSTHDQTERHRVETPRQTALSHEVNGVRDFGVQCDRDLDNLEDHWTEISTMHQQLEELRSGALKSHMERKDWRGAEAELRALIELEEKQYQRSLSITRKPSPLISREKLWKYQHMLGLVLLHQKSFTTSETWARRAYDNRCKNLGEKHESTRESALQLANVLMKLGADDKQLEAERIYYNHWRQATLDKCALDCGHGLGELYYEQKREGEAEVQLRKVWEEKKGRDVPFESLLRTGNLLHDVLFKTKKHAERTRILEHLWEKHTGVMSEDMIDAAFKLGSRYYDLKQYGKAAPVLKAVWTTRNSCQRQSTDACTCNVCTHSHKWIDSAQHLALAVVSGRLEADYSTVKASLERLTENEKSLAEYKYKPEVWNLYGSMLCLIGQDEQTIQVFEQWWTTPIAGSWASGMIYADALCHRERYQEAVNVYQTIFDDRKEDIEDETEKQSAIDVGEKLRQVLRKLGKSKKASQLSAELKTLREQPPSEQKA